MPCIRVCVLLYVCSAVYGAPYVRCNERCWGYSPHIYSISFQPIIPLIYQSAKFQSNEQQEENEGSNHLSYYGLYLLDYLRTNKFEQATDDAFIRERADRAAERMNRAWLEGYPADGAQELAMDTLLRGASLFPEV